MKFEFRDDKYLHKIRVATYNFIEDGIGMIYEKRDLEGRIVEVWQKNLQPKVIFEEHSTTEFFTVQLL